MFSITATNSNQTKKRRWSPYELTQLAKYGLEWLDLQHTEAPVEYLTGHVTFDGLDFLVSPDTLIPRIETEELVELCWQHILNHNSTTPIRVLDVGTGSGAIAISLANRAREAEIPVEFFASDISVNALAIAQTNAKRLAPDYTINFLQSDLLSQIPAEPLFDLVVANLPYIPTSRIEYLEKSVKDFEPCIALDGGSEGLSLIFQLLDSSPPYLTTKGIVLLEVDYTHTMESFAHYSSWAKVSVHIDSLNKNRFIEIEKK